MSSGERSVDGGLVPVAVLLIASPLADLAAALLPVRPGEVSWRFGAYGLMVTALVTPILGLGILTAIGGLRHRRGMLAFLAAVCGVLSLVIIGGFALFVLDTLQLRQAVGVAARGPYDSAALKAMFIAVVEAVVLLLMAVAAFQSSGLSITDAGHRRRRRVGLVVQTDDEPVSSGPTP